VSAADVAAVLPCSRREAAGALDRLVDAGRALRHEGDGFSLWTSTLDDSLPLR
jgi:hypothetical protein